MSPSKPDETKPERIGSSQKIVVSTSSLWAHGEQWPILPRTEKRGARVSRLACTNIQVRALGGRGHRTRGQGGHAAETLVLPPGVCRRRRGEAVAAGRGVGTGGRAARARPACWHSCTWREGRDRWMRGRGMAWPPGTHAIQWGRIEDRERPC